jgi:hypothetical protein
MRAMLKSIMERAAPTALDLARGLRNRWYFGRRFARLHAAVKSELYRNEQEIRVISGPFEGMRYLDAIVWGPITPKWLGSYETELSTVIEEIVGGPYSTVIDVGCAEGYYAVGLAYRMPRAKVFAFDNDLVSRWQVAKLAALNHATTRISIGRYCSHETFNLLCSERVLVICDIEGYERDLLDPERAGRLKDCDVLVEVHEWDNDATTERTITNRFGKTHHLERIDACERISWCAEHPELMPPSLLSEATNEHRSNGRRWLWMKAKSSRPEHRSQ